MRPALNRINVIRERKNVFAVTVVVLERRFNLDVVFSVIYIKYLFVEGVL